MHRIAFMIAVAVVLAVSACSPDAGERITGPATRQADEIPQFPPLSEPDTLLTTQPTSGGNAFGSGN